LILLDTNVVSELTRRQPDALVEAFFRQQPPQSLFTASVCEAEIRYGLAQLPRGRRRNDLASRVISFLSAAFDGRILPFDSAAAALYGEIRVSRLAIGRPIGVADAMIAATARVFGVAIATRDEADFTECGVRLVNPWSDQARASGR
jgi:predicted nucleic acid-binding protein